MIFYFDKINKIQSGEYKRRSLPYDKFFGEMDLTDYGKERRIAIAKSIEDAIAFLFTVLPIYAVAGYIDRQNLVNQFKSKYEESLLSNDVVFDDAIIKHINKSCEEIVGTTIDNFVLDNENYFTSDDRAILVAENEANGIVNYEEYDEALLVGFTHKTWHTMQDKKVRKGHQAVEGNTIPIEDYFDVDGDQMLYPMDESMGASASNIVNCRCTITYSKNDEDAE